MGLLGTAIGGLLQGVAGLGAGPAPKLSLNETGVEDNARIADMKADADKTGAEYAAQAGQGSREAGQSFLGGKDQAVKDASLGGQSGTDAQGQSQAIQNKAKRSFENSQAGLNRQNSQYGYARHQQAVDTYNHYSMRAKAINMGIQQAQNQANLQYDANRNSAIASALGGVGALGGAIAGQAKSGNGYTSGQEAEDNMRKGHGR